ncbi:MAG: ADP-ribosyl-[dinitrogen reductase] hydrolase [Desulfuromonadaceae bacterium]|nr:ADP-ribosyl-[dinitrogen reductase] hydrolase [Desulfuromonadaceae bacterium]
MADPGRTTFNREELVARAQAAFLGLALGDALGATTEFLLPGEIRYRHKVHNKIIGGGWLNLKAGQVTDDTQMSLCIARAIDETGGWDRVRIMELFAEWLKTRPVDVGATCRRSISRYIIKGEIGKEYSDQDAGNGAAMRMAPVALFALGNEDLLQEQAVDQARLTHNNKLSDAACITIGRLVQQAILGADRPSLHSLVRELYSECPKFQCKRYRGGASAYVVETMQTVFHYFFGTAHFEECLVGVVNQGGDADTTGAIAGMIAGAFYGLDSLPKKWLRKLDPAVGKEIKVLAERLVDLSPLGRQF